ncbi:MAG: hypothetical protein JNJ99_08195, partial [Crocinitomicaceae bacterium]|nr:hypothetical protein [Crocinitomicaceae bacterium]
MNEYNENTEPKLKAAEEEVKQSEQPEEKKKDRLFSGRTVMQIINGEFLTRDYFLKNLPFTFYIGFLFVVIIAWGYYGET